MRALYSFIYFSLDTNLDIFVTRELRVGMVGTRFTTQEYQSASVSVTVWFTNSLFINGSARAQFGIIVFIIIISRYVQTLWWDNVVLNSGIRLYEKALENNFISLNH